jgi:tRNA(fMet)-specific endonuclease VapC
MTHSKDHPRENLNCGNGMTKMTKYLFDTNAVIVYLNGRSERLKQHLQRLDRDRIYVCSVVKAELYYGAMRTQHPAVTLQKQNQFLDGFVSLTFDDKAARYYGQIRATLVK